MSPVRSHYDEDFYAWTQAQAALLREEKVADLDYANLAEEIESLGKSDRRALESRLERLLQHLLKWCYQPREQSTSWRLTIREQRRRIVKLLRDSPSLRREVAAFIEAGYPYAREQALDETGVAQAAMPAECPWTEAQILDVTFWPETDEND